VGESIKEECLGHFLGKDVYQGLLKVLLPILAFFMTGAVAYAWNEIEERKDIKVSIHLIEKKQEFMQDTVIDKLTQQAAVYARLDTKLDSLLKK